MRGKKKMAKIIDELQEQLESVRFLIYRGNTVRLSGPLMQELRDREHSLLQAIAICNGVLQGSTVKPDHAKAFADASFAKLKQFYQHMAVAGLPVVPPQSKPKSLAIKPPGGVLTGITASASGLQPPGPNHPAYSYWPEDLAKAVPALPEREVTSEVIAYRTWMLDQKKWIEPVGPGPVKAFAEVDASMPINFETKIVDGYFLKSTNQSFTWMGPVVDAGGEPADIRPPVWSDAYERDRDGIHGIYAYNDLRGALGHASAINAAAGATGHWSGMSFGPHPSVVGAVQLTGKVVVHDKGYRAERALVRSLYLMPGLVFDLVRLKKLEELRTNLEQRYQCPVLTDMVTFMEMFPDGYRT